MTEVGRNANPIIMGRVIIPCIFPSSETAQVWRWCGSAQLPLS